MNRDSYRKSVLSNIKKYDFHATSVLAENEDPQYTYSTGIQESQGKPEIIIIGLESSLAHTLSCIYYNKLKSGEVFKIGVEYSGFLKGCKVMFCKVPKDKLEEYMLCVPWIYEENENEAIQLIYPDDNELFSWEKGVHESIIREQPILDEKFLSDKKREKQNAEEEMSNKKIICDNHGEQKMTLVCQHLTVDGKSKALGFYQPKERFNDIQAWCAACDNELEKVGWEWNDENEAFSSIKLLCYQCFSEIKAKQIELNPEKVQLDDEKLPDDDEFYDLAGKFIDLANDLTKDYDISEIGDSFIYAASRYNAFETVMTEDNLEDNRQKIIDSFCAQYRMSLIDNLKDYEKNKENYIKK